VHGSIFQKDDSGIKRGTTVAGKKVEKPGQIPEKEKKDLAEEEESCLAINKHGAAGKSLTRRRCFIIKKGNREKGSS